ncbi:MAG: histidine phosphatase family protein [Burkholderiales bacterium]
MFFLAIIARCRNAFSAVAALLLLSLAQTSFAQGSVEGALEGLKQGGHVLLMRHAQTEPGTGDPAGFKLGDCATQRNLSAEGKAQAEQFGKKLAALGFQFDPVLSSEWCRAMDTAKLAFGKAEPWPVVNSINASSDDKIDLSAQLRIRIRDFKGPGNLVIVTHGYNIQYLTGENIQPGDALVMHSSGSGFRLMGVLNLSSF